MALRKRSESRRLCDRSPVQPHQLASLGNHNLKSVCWGEGKPIFLAHFRPARITAPGVLGWNPWLYLCRSPLKEDYSKDRTFPSINNRKAVERWKAVRRKIGWKRWTWSCLPLVLHHSIISMWAESFFFDLFIKKWNAFDGSGRRRWPYLIDRRLFLPRSSLLPPSRFLSSLAPALGNYRSFVSLLGKKLWNANRPH